MVDYNSAAAWTTARACLMDREPGFYELESGGAVALPLGEEGWLLEVTPQGDLICQTGYELEDMKSILSDGTAEDIGSDELAKQAKFYLQQTVASYREGLRGAGFEESAEMNDEYVAVMFRRGVDFQKIEDVVALVRWCQRQFAGPQPHLGSGATT